MRVTYIESPNTLYRQLWSPVQNTALWLGWWLHDVIGADYVIDAFHAVQGSRHRVVFADEVVAIAPEIVPEAPVAGLVGLMAKAREVTEGAPMGLEDRPLVSLLLAGPGDVPLLPAGTGAADHVMRVGSGIVLSDAQPARCHVLVPDVGVVSGESPRQDHAPGLVSGGGFEGFPEEVLWTWYVVDQPVPPLPVYSPGEADEMLRHAVENSTRMVESSGHSPGLVSFRGGAQGVRLAVGSLADAFGLPGVPPGVPTRSQRLMARADTVAAIIDLSTRSAGGADLDPHLLPMMKAVRVARMVAVDYALRELVR
ncbi:hypothetical protein GC425_00510 [Corynebacterium sp. zg254]|uniref:Uncharacterized protein n=1 Tax=Corynebacterium zhongnanshanii TaxID=2768834 RepID=A0ABQ6VHB1_9CORY|nr:MULTISPECIES: hypothetical protein [Corynebacterium]KAB3523685.1 hypothetical protein F8377_05120 [Corynebacterium zhongnanshanii]MCR5913357.1 hypothetical protein [Corynebacterium sp. zg254]